MLPSSSCASDDRTPMPRRCPRPFGASRQDDSYFLAQMDDAASFAGSLTTEDTSSHSRDISPARKRSVEASPARGITLAQQELVSRALTPEMHAQGRHSPSSRSSVNNDPPTDRQQRDPPVQAYDLQMPSRTGYVSQTPSSLPETLPSPNSLPRVPISNPSTMPEDALGGNFPLVMPTVPLPAVAQRKPFTDQGRRVGRLRIMFCGDSGAGKTKLLQTIITCPDIVFTEDVSAIVPGSPVTEIIEVRASTQPYPSWKLLSSATHPVGDDVVMERNLTLLDTPGFYALSQDANDATGTVLAHLEACLQETCGILRGAAGHLADDELIDLVASSSSTGLSLVDAIIYCIANELTEIDLDYIHRLAGFSTVMPVITKADWRDEDTLQELVAKTRVQLQQIGLPFFTRLDGTDKTPLLVSCIDTETDASLMMTHGYSFDHGQSDLAELCATIFHDDSPARLRHLAARKFLDWRTAKLSQMALRGITQEQESGLLLLPSPDFTMTRVAEHNRREDKRSRLRLSAWTERMRTSYTLARPNGERVPPNPAASEKSAAWIMSRLNDFVEHDQRNNGTPSTASDKRRQLIHAQEASDVDVRDPFGLIRLRERWNRRIKRTVSLLVELSCGVGLLSICFSLVRSVA
ncbi:hypothetical protein PYCC9005_003898 [Savitreella phatthalungensis]